ncbi:MAG TPA: hypothetical protein VFZ09_51075 [Archangium sp.]|uniref:hypothetical protein n=1 Tax=Archangium sp. TaxID=1872627 RepID=UPI002E2FAD44|nr:hypothetical protein [Archangium sp.]HEX5754631.1 hypothetical protein [Archangium sp.]
MEKTEPGADGWRGPGFVCEQFKAKFNEILARAVRGSMVTTSCHKKTTPTIIQFNF